SETGDTPRLDALSFDIAEPGPAPIEIEDTGEAHTAAEAPVLHEVPDLPIASDGVERVGREAEEIDLSTALSGLLAASEGEAPLGAVSGGGEPIADIEDIFAKKRAKSGREQHVSEAFAQYEQALTLIEQGLDREAISTLESVARVPMIRFKAAARLGRFLIDRGDLNEGIEWLERAAEAPAPSLEEGYDLLYELAGALEAQGESARALAVLMELDAEADGYRDVSTRIMYLSRAQQSESHRS